MNFASWTQITGSATGDFGTAQQHTLGQAAMTRDGRKFRYALNGAVALVAGEVIQGPAIVTTHLAMTPVAAAIGATQVTVALGATLATANQYAQGYLQVDTAPGPGRCYQVTGHPAAALSTSVTVQLDPSDPIRVALTTTSRVGLVANPWNGVIEMPVTTATGVLAGVAVEALPIANYGWLQTGGPACVLINGTPALGYLLSGVSASTAGSVDAAVSTTNGLTGQTTIGRMMQIGVSTKYNMVYLDID